MGQYLSWLAHVSAGGSCLWRRYDCLFCRRVIISRVSCPNSCQLSQKLWKYSIFGISAALPDIIEIIVRALKLFGGGEEELMRQAARVIGLVLAGEKKNTTKLKRLNGEVIKLGLNVRYLNCMMCSGLLIRDGCMQVLLEAEGR